jgi:hypothetical protein
MVVRLSALRAGRALPATERFLILICYNMRKPQGHIATGRIGEIEKLNDLIGESNR